MTRKKIAIVGGGIYGVTIASKLSPKNQVDIFEKNSDILKGASLVNQFRLHRGYHYPRGPETIISCLRSEPIFRREYKEAIIDDFDHYYCIAKTGSLTSKENYLKTLNFYKLQYKPEWVDIVNKDSVDLCVKVKEKAIDYKTLYKICWDKIKKSKVNVLLNTTADLRKLAGYDLVIINTYSYNNRFLKNYPQNQRFYQHELCEKIIVRLPPKFNNKAVVIMDGPFTCVDPFGKTGLFIMGHVVHAIHHRNIGKNPICPKGFEKLVNNGIIKNPPITNFNKIITAAKEFFPDIVKAKHVGSMYTFRTVLPNKDKTDERPAIVRFIGNRFITVFSGKISNCVDCAEQIADYAKRTI